MRKIKNGEMVNETLHYALTSYVMRGEGVQQTASSKQGAGSCKKRGASCKL
jgi:hypothetical protein